MAFKMFRKFSLLHTFCVKCVISKKIVCNMSTRVADVLKQKPIGSQASLKGWVSGIRKMKEIVFIDLMDGSCSEHIQVFIHKSKAPKKLSYGSAVEAVGQVQITSKGQLELNVDKISVVSTCVITDGYPLTPGQTYTPDYLRQFLHLRPRSNTFGSLLRVRDVAMQAFHQHFRQRGFIFIHTPVITSNDCEGAGEVFLVTPENENLLKSMVKEGTSTDTAYFDSKAFLTVSGQMHLEAAVRAFSHVYTIGPTFRAENSKTRFHLSEFYMIEAEVAFLKSLSDILGVMEIMIKSVTKHILDKCEEDVHLLHSANGCNLSFAHLTEKPFITMSYDEAVNILNKHSDNFQVPVKYGQNLGKEHELFLVKINEGIPTFVVEWPRNIKPFYMKEVEEDRTKVSAVDLLTPEVGELCGGSLREDDFSILRHRLIEAGLDTTLSWYLELRKYGNAPTAGFGMGFERYLQLVLGISNIKDTIPFPRWPHNCQM